MALINFFLARGERLISNWAMCFSFFSCSSFSLHYWAKVVWTSKLWIGKHLFSWGAEVRRYSLEENQGLAPWGEKEWEPPSLLKNGLFFRIYRVELSLFGYWRIGERSLSAGRVSMVNQLELGSAWWLGGSARRIGGWGRRG